MELHNGDEHYQEFERVFQTVNKRQDSNFAGSNLSHASSVGTGSQVKCYTGDHVCKLNEFQPTPGCVSDLFADFFDNDETFLEFEKEFEQFRSRRRSNLFGSLNSVGSSRDIFGDVKAYCERSMKSTSGSRVSVNSCSRQDEATPSCGDEQGCHQLIWRSVDDWEKMLRKMRRNSRLLLDIRRPIYVHNQHRHSVSENSRRGKESEAYYKTQSLADLRRCHETGIERKNSPGNRSSGSQSAADILQLESSQNAQKSELGPMLDISSLSDSLSNDDDDSCSGKWSETYEGDTRYSSSSTLCSANEDLCCSFSCSCCSDLHNGDDTDCDISIDGLSPPVRERSQSLMEFKANLRPTNLHLHSNSMDNLFTPNKHSRVPHIHSYTRDATLGEARMGQARESDQHYLDDDTPTDDESILSGNLWSRPPSTVSAQLSDADSEHFLTASSDLSDHYWTAKSDLSGHISGPEFESKSRSLSMDISEALYPLAALDDRVFEWASNGKGVDNSDEPSFVRGQYHSYHGKENRVKRKYARLRSGSACQYTCHQHCLPAVTLNCKSISDDGSEIAFARTPSPSDPRSLLETSLSMGSMCARPGCARVVLSSNTRTDTTTSGLPKVSESVPNFQHLGQRSELAGSDIHQDFCEYAGASLHHLPQTASAGFVTVHSSTNQTITASNPTNSSPSHQNSSSCYIPPYSDIQTGSLKQTQLQYKTTQHGPDQDGSVVSDKTFQGSSSGFIVSDSTNNNSIPQEPENSEDTTSDLPDIMSSQDAATEKDETDSGYRSGTIPDDKLPRVPSQATLDRQELVRKIAKYNHFVPAVNLEMTGKESFQGFIKVTMNLIRPITMELGARPPSIYELLTKEHIVDQNTQQVAFYMPRDTHKSLHITSDTTTKEVVTSLLKKFHILDHPRKFAMYEQEFNERNKLVRLRRLNDKDFPLRAIISWDPERIKNYRVVLQENETGEIVWDVFSLPELGNFLKVLDREEKEMILELKHKYAYMKQYMERRLTELRNERNKKAKN